LARLRTVTVFGAPQSIPGHGTKNGAGFRECGFGGRSELVL